MLERLRRRGEKDIPSRPIELSVEDRQKEFEQAKPVKLNLTGEAAFTVRELAKRDGVDVIEAVRRMIAMSSFINDELAKGQIILTSDPEGRRMEKVKFVYRDNKPPKQP